MPQPVLNLLEGNTVCQQEGCAAMSLEIGGKLRGQIIGPYPFAQFVYEDEAVIVIVIAVAADLLVQFLRRLDLRKIFL